MTGEIPFTPEQGRTPTEFAGRLHAKLSKLLSGAEYRPPSYSAVIKVGRQVGVVSDDNSYMLKERDRTTSLEQRKQDIVGGQAILSLMQTDTPDESNRFLLFRPHNVNPASYLGYYLAGHPDILAATKPEEYVLLHRATGQVTEPYSAFLQNIATSLGVQT